MNITEEKVGSSLEHMGIGDHFLNIAPVTQTLRPAINKWALPKLRSLCMAKDTLTNTK